jgi:DNA-binding transcriptional ArsR family regulator
MNSDAFVSFRSGRPEGPRVRVVPAPLLELLYAAFYLTRWSGDDDEALPWARRLWREAPDVARAAAALARRDAPSPAPTLFPLAMTSGHALDAGPERFLARLPELAEQARRRLRDAAAEAGAAPDEPAAAARAADVDEALAGWLLSPEDPTWPEAVQAALRALWAEIGPGWEAEGRPQAEAAAARVRAGLEEHGDVLRALPEHHFAQFEKLAAVLRDAAERGRLWIVPLALAAGGGFHTEIDEITALGFGLQSDQAHARAEQRVAAAAATAKALADPTRLMLLHLVARYPGLSLTVGDLARQLGVSQPTVSGHLKQLRDAGLVRSERRGNRAYPRVDRGALDAALQRLGQALDADRSS